MDKLKKAILTLISFFVTQTVTQMDYNLSVKYLNRKRVHMINSRKPDDITDQLICSLCNHTIENQKIIDSYKANRPLLVKHCIDCLTLQPPKNRSIRKRLKIFIKHPYTIRFICRDLSSEDKCNECGSEYFVTWNGCCPKCGETLYLKSK